MDALDRLLEITDGLEAAVERLIKERDAALLRAETAEKVVEAADVLAKRAESFIYCTAREVRGENGLWDAIDAYKKARSATGKDAP